MAKVIGINIGGTRACVAVMEKQPIVIANAKGERTIPTIVAYTPEGTWLTGEAAQAQSLHDPANAFHSVTQFLGRRYEEVAEAATSVPYQVLSDSKGDILLNCPNLPEPLPPEAILAPLLRQLTEDASAYLDAEVTQAVLTVPVHFTDAQRAAMKRAAQLAELEVLRLLPETTAACLAYDLDQENGIGILVLSLDRSTLGVTVLEVGDSVFEVLATTTTDLTPDGSEAELESDCLNHCRQIIEQAIAEAKLRSQVGTYQVEISNVVLVGDAGRSAALSALAQQLTGITPLQKYPADENVGMGAAILAGRLEGEGWMREFVCPPPDVACRLGVETSDGLMLPLIERGSSFPISRTITFSTAVDGQTSVEIPILRGLRVQGKDNQRLRTLSLHRILPAPQGVPQIEVTFAIDIAETLEVTAKDCATGETASTRIYGALSFSREEANRLYGDAAQNERIDAAIDPAKFRQPISDLIHQMQDEAPRNYLDSRIPTLDITKLKRLLEQLQIAIAPLENSNCLKPATSSTTMLPVAATTLIGARSS